MSQIPSDSPPGATDPHALCEQKVTAADLALYYGLLFLPPGPRRAVTPLYALWSELREIDDECSEAEVARLKLAWWHEEIHQIFAGQPRHPVATALAPVARAHQLPVEPFLELIESLAQHAGRTSYPTFDALRAHGIETRGRLESLAARLAGGTDPEASEWAAGLGAGVEVAALLLDTGAGAARGRVYLPQEDMMRFGVSTADLTAGRETEPARNLIAFEAERLSRELEHDVAAAPRAARASLLTSLTAARIARAALARIRRDPARVLRERPRLTALRQLWIAWRTARGAHAA